MPLEDVLVLINRLVSGGGTIEYAERIARGAHGHEPALVDEALRRLEELRRTVRHLKDPVVVEDPDVIQPWYPGPQPGDIFWYGLRDSMLKHDLPLAALEQQVDPASSKIVSYLDPPGHDVVDSRGLVVGHVQSGKTTSFMSVIAKAADSGYRIFVVLSGIHDGLRIQTYERIRDQLIAPTESNWFDLTPDGDFGSPMPAAQLLADQNKRAIAVVKKNPHRLARLVAWLEAAPPELLRTRPLLVIDDEADQASIDVGKARRSTINQRILDVLASPKAAYVAYTATPFANLLIDRDAGNLYPSDFVVDLPQPEGHYGTERIFGRLPISEDESPEDLDGLDVVRHVPDEEVAVLRPPSQRANRDAWSAQLTDSLREAIEYFVLASAARRARGQNGHSSMLVHTTMLADPQLQMKAPIERHVVELAQAWSAGTATARFREQWDREQLALPPETVGMKPVLFQEIEKHIGAVLSDIKVIVDNYRSTDRLSYGDEPRTVIAVGGNTLSRGLTLYGLSVSFFVRAASAYDTLLQMGRWFGYRTGYEDLPRVWMTAELHEWFIHLATVEAEIRSDVRRYEAEHRTPRELAVRIRTHPAMVITDRAKMRAAQQVSVSYAASRIQTILFNHLDAPSLSSNLAAARRLVQGAMANGTAFAPREGHAGWWMAEGVPWSVVRGFVESYAFHQDAADLKSETIIKYVEGQRSLSSLHHWNVVIAGLPDGGLGTLDVGLPAEVGLIRRSRMNIPGLPHANIKALMSKVDRVADLPDLDDEAAGLSNEQLQERRPRRVGLLVLYPIQARSDPQATPGTGLKARTALAASADVIGVGLVFPDAEGNGLGEVEYVAAFRSEDVEDVEELTEEAIRELDTADEEAAKASDVVS